MSLGSGGHKPYQRLLRILFHTLSLDIAYSEIILGVCVSLDRKSVV